MSSEHPREREYKCTAHALDTWTTSVRTMIDPFSLHPVSGQSRAQCTKKTTHNSEERLFLEPDAQLEPWRLNHGCSFGAGCCLARRSRNTSMPATRRKKSASMEESTATRIVVRRVSMFALRNASDTADEQASQ